MAHKHMKRCLTPWVSGEVQTEITGETTPRPRNSSVRKDARSAVLARMRENWGAGGSAEGENHYGKQHNSFFKK